MTEIHDKLVECFQTVFPELGQEEIPAASMVSVASWDSVATLTLMAVVEEQFAVSIEPAAAGDLISFALLRAFLEGGANVS